MQYTSSQYEQFWLHELGKATRTGKNSLRAACPVHGGDSPNTLSIDLNTGFAHCFKCHQDGQGWSMIEFAMARHGFNRQCANDYVRGIIGDLPKPSVAPWHYPFPKPRTITGDEWQLGTLARRIQQMTEFFDQQGEPGWEVVAQYAYETIRSLKYKAVHRITGEKRLFWLTLTEKGGWSKPAKQGVVAPPYRVGALNGTEEIWLLNGEKAVDRAVEAWQIDATCLPNGEGHWREDYLPWFAHAKTIYLVLDNDAQGEQHGKVVGGALAKAGLEARLVRLPGLAEKADLWDFIEAGGTQQVAHEIARQAPLAEPYDPPARAADKVKQMPRRDPPPGGGDDDTGPPIDGPDLTGFDRNDVGNAERLVAVAGDRLRFVEQLDQNWMIYDAQRWRAGAIRTAYTPAVQTLRLLKQQANRRGDDKLWKFAESKLSHGGIQAMIHQAEPRLMIDVSELDRHPFLIPCLNGVYDLETGKLREHRPEDYLTRIFPFAYDPTLPEPVLWLRSLDEWFGGGPEAGESELDRAERMSRYFRRVFARSLTGDVQYKAFHVLYGSGDNGKTTCTGVIQDILSEYAVTISPNTLTRAWSHNENNALADVARTKGARAIFAAEPTQGQKFDQGLLKQLTQGDSPITAVFKGRQPFSFLPTGKLFLETNQVPEFDSGDAAFLRRIHLIHFSASFTGGERARESRRQQLCAEYPQIFNLAIKDAQEYMRTGLMLPEECRISLRDIQDAQAANDELEPFLEEFFQRASGLVCTLIEIENLYRPWCERHRLRPLPRNLLSRKLTERIGIERGNDPKNHKEPAWLKGLAPKPGLGARAMAVGKDAQYKDALFKEPEDD
jgi:P4 family phage/plasmid primase-like protien